MHQHARTHTFGRLCCTLLGLGALVLAGTRPVAAQGWQETIGGNNPSGEEGMAAVEAANGDMLVAGFSFTFSGTAELYVIRTDAFGTIRWHNIYQIPGFVFGLAWDIKEFPNGDLAVVGRTTDGSGLGRALVMRLTSAGAPIWATTLGDANTSMEAHSAVITTLGSGAAQPGDIVICGRSGLWSGPHGILARLDGNGNLIWFTDYDITIVGGVSSGELNGVDEARIPTSSNAGDIVAAGYQAGAAGGADVPGDIWVLRVDGNTGTSFGAGLGSATYGTPRNDVGQSIKELRFGANGGDLAVSGSSDGRPGAATEIVVLQSLPDPTDAASPRASSFIGDGGARRDWGNSICEIPPGVGGTVGNMVVGGTTENGTFGGSDVFIQEVREGTLNAVGPMHYMGGNRDDIGRSVSPVVHGPTSNGYIITGYTESTDIMPPGNQRNLYLLKNYNTLANNCRSNTFPVTDVPAGLTPVVNTIVETNAVTVTPVSVLPARPSWRADQLCFPDSKIMVPGADPAAAPDGGVTIEAHPSLVRRGDAFSLDYALSVGGEVTVTISDVAGHVVRETTVDRAAGDVSELIRTGGWSAGTYLARISAGGYVATSRIVVIDR